MYLCWMSTCDKSKLDNNNSILYFNLFKVFDTVTHQISFEFELPTNDSIYSLAHTDALLFAGALSGSIYVSYRI